MEKPYKYHEPCNDCGSSDALALYEDHSYCFSCGTYNNYKQESSQQRMQLKTQNSSAGKKPIREIPEAFEPIKDRGISKSAAEKFKVSYIDDTTDRYVHVYPYTRKGKHVGNKLRRRDAKEFIYEGEATKLDLFGQSIFPAGCSRFITIVEGECDALAAYDMQGDWPVVSVRSSTSAETDVRNNFEYLNSFEEIVICFDNDEQGQSAATRVADILPMGKVRIVTLSEGKDANEYLQRGLTKKFKDEWWRGPKYTPAGLRLGSELWEEIINPPSYETIPYPFEGMNEKTYGLRLSEFVLLNAPPKVGKTTLLGEITYSILQNNKDTKVGLMKLEESNRDSIINLMSLKANKRLNLPDVWDEEDPKEIKKYYDEVANNDRIVLWDHFGSNSVQAVLDKVRHMHALGCKYIILDHISIIVSDQSGDERKQLDEIATKLKTLCMELNICVIAVVHQNRQGEIRGTQGLEQLANIIFKLERDKLSDNDVVRNITKLTVTENRFCGETGVASYLYFNPDTGRLNEISEAEYNKAAVSGEAPW